MDKQDFVAHIDRLKRAVDEKDYVTALKIVQEIEWKRVKSPNLLGLAASVYEENDLLEDAKDVLVIALERSSGGKRILYKLTELAVRSGNVEEAEDYYQEYRSIASSDPACLLLQYMILKVKHAPYAQLINCLEYYNEYEPDEKWMYELATTYEGAGRIQDAVGLCDRIVLMFGTSVYGVKALKLKQKYVKLTDEQRALLYPNSIANAGEHYEKGEPRYTVRTTERLEEPAPAPATLADQLAAARIPDEDYAFEMYLREHDPLKDQNVPEEKPIVPEEVIRNANGPVPVERVYEPEAPAPAPAPEPVEVRTPIPVGKLAEAQAARPAEAAPATVPVAEPAAAAVTVAASAAAVAASEQDAEAEAVKALEEEHLNEGFLTEEPAEAAPAPVAEPAPAPAPVAESAPAPAAPAPVITEETVIKTPVVPEELPSHTDPEAELMRADAAISDARLAAAAGVFPAGAPQPQARTSFTVTKPEETEQEEEPAYAAPAAATSAAPASAPAAAVKEKESAPTQPRFVPGLHLIIEAVDEEEGVEIARKELGVIYHLRGENRKVAKASAEKLNQLGDMGAVAEKIGDRDLVISAAGDLIGEVADQLYEMLEDRRSERSIVFVDTPEGLDMLEETLPELFDICDILIDEDARKKDYAAAMEEEEDRLAEAGTGVCNGDVSLCRQQTPSPMSATNTVPVADDDTDEEEEEVRPAGRKPLTTKKNDLLSNTGNVPFHMPESDDEILEFEDFAQYCIHYANGMGCSISGKTLLALYEKIEIMEEDGIALTRIAAEDCVEEAADHAEHPGMKGIFRKKYDKDDMLILREEDFIN